MTPISSALSSAEEKFGERFCFLSVRVPIRRGAVLIVSFRDCFPVLGATEPASTTGRTPVSMERVGLRVCICRAAGTCNKVFGLETVLMPSDAVEY